MKPRWLMVVDWVLRGVGAITLAGAVGLGAVMIHWSVTGSRARIDEAEFNEVQYVLDHCQVGRDKFEKVEHSYRSAWEHFRVYAIRVAPLELNTLEAAHGELDESWYRGDQLPMVLSDAVAYMEGWELNTPWFPKREKIGTRECYAMLCSIRYKGMRPEAAEFAFYDPAERVIYFFGGKN